MKLIVNDKEYDVDVDPEMPLLWVLRDELGIPGRNTGVVLLCAGPAPCMWMAQRKDRARYKWAILTGGSQRSKGLELLMSCMRCNRHGSNIRLRNVGTVNRGKSCRRLICWPETQPRTMAKSTMQWLAIFAAAERIRALDRPFTAQQQN
ncbi:hypothetical protein SuNHUV7_17390 (plasmid) [Pseudoseohaeicola sp. NH-UV-7]